MNIYVRILAKHYTDLQDYNAHAFDLTEDGSKYKYKDSELGNLWREEEERPTKTELDIFLIEELKESKISSLYFQFEQSLKKRYRIKTQVDYDENAIYVEFSKENSDYFSKILRYYKYSSNDDDELKNIFDYYRNQVTVTVAQMKLIYLNISGFGVYLKNQLLQKMAEVSVCTTEEQINNISWIIDSDSYVPNDEYIAPLKEKYIKTVANSASISIPHGLDYEKIIGIPSVLVEFSEDKNLLPPLNGVLGNYFVYVRETDIYIYGLDDEFVSGNGRVEIIIKHK